MLPAALTLVVMRALLRAPHGRGTPRDLGTRVMRAEADVLSALQEAAERGWAKPMPGLWDGTWFEATALGLRVAAWTLVREELPFSQFERRRVDERLGLAVAVPRRVDAPAEGR